MDIAVSGLSPLALPGFDRGRQQRPEQPAQQDRSRNNRNEQSSQNTTRQNRSENEGRVVQGEVLSSRTDTADRSANSTQSTLQERTATSDQPDTRRFSKQAAIQVFRETEAIIAAPGEQRQVSGIIDEFV
jgi:hypothetical protein